MNPLYKMCLLRMLLFLGYAHLGGWLFSLIEKSEESNVIVANRTLENLREEMKTKHNISNSSEFYKFVDTAYEARKLKQKLDWSFMSGCSFAMSTIMTVGYGDITPETALGQMLIIPFCLIGLPLTMLALKTAGEVILVILTRFQICFEKRILRRKNPETTFSKMFLMVAFGITSLICLLATGSMYVRDWTYTEAVYFWFITFTTIGFGDYSPFAIDNEKIYTKKTILEEIFLYLAGAVYTIPYIAGFCLISSLLNLLVEWSERINVKFKCCGLCDMRRRVRYKSKNFFVSDHRTAPDHPMSKNNFGEISLKLLSTRRFSV